VDDWYSSSPLKDAHFISVFNQSELPAGSICCGFCASGLPFGLQISGRRFDDLGVLQMTKFSIRPGGNGPSLAHDLTLQNKTQFCVLSIPNWR